MNFAFVRKVLFTFLLTRHMTRKKFFNLLHIAWQYLFSRPDVVSGYPLRLIIDPTNICGLKCPLCPTGQGSSARPRGIMPFDNFKSILDEVSDYLFEVELCNWGEPLLNPELPNMVRYVRSRNIRVRFSSTLNQLTDELAEDLVLSGLSEISVSLDGASRETYETYRRGGKFDVVISNVKKISSFKIKHKSRNPKLIWQFIVFKHNEHEIAAAKAMAKALGFDSLFIRPMRSDMKSEVFLSDKEKIASSSAWLPKKDRLSRYDYAKERRKHRPSNCLFLWTQIVINWNGSVASCCAIYEQKNDFGKIDAGESVLAVWNNKTFQRARRLVREKDVTKDSVCTNCLKNGFIEY